MHDFYRNLPNVIDPVAVHIGTFSVYWYSVMWIFAFAVVYVLLLYRLKRRESDYSATFIQDVLSNAFLGALLGGRLGYVIFYDLGYYMENPIAIISPYDFVMGEWVGIYGMSFHGGIIGVACALYLTARKNAKKMLSLTDFIVPAVPMGYFFGRVGNFINQELVGRATTSWTGMYFNDEKILRHPSQLYEALSEGLILFTILWLLRNKLKIPGFMSGIFLGGYALMRFIAEYFREPDEHIGLIGDVITMGQIFSIVMFGCAVIMLIYAYCYRKCSLFE